MTPPAARQPGEGAVRPDIDTIEYYTVAHVNPNDAVSVVAIDLIELIAYIRTVPDLLAAAEVKGYQRGVEDAAREVRLHLPSLTGDVVAEQIRALIPGISEVQR